VKFNNIKSYIEKSNFDFYILGCPRLVEEVTGDLFSSITISRND